MTMFHLSAARSTRETQPAISGGREGRKISPQGHARGQTTTEGWRRPARSFVIPV